MPAQPAADAGALGDQVVAVVDQQAQLARLTVEPGDGQIRLAQGGTGDRQGIDGVGLALLATAAASTGHQARRDADSALAGPQQVDLEPPGEVAAVLDGENAARPAAHPSEDLEMTVGGGRDRLLRQLASRLIGGHQRVAALVRIDADQHHAPLPLTLPGQLPRGPDGDTPLSRIRPGSYQVTPSGPGTLGGWHKEEQPQLCSSGQRRNEPTRRAW